MDWKYKLVTWLAWHLPRSVTYWAAVRVAVHDYDGDPGERTAVEMLDGWGTP